MKLQMHDIGVSVQIPQAVAVISADKQHNDRLSRDADCHCVTTFL